MSSTLGFLTAPHLADLTPDDQRVLPHLAALGIEVRPVIWPDARWIQDPHSLLSGLDALVMRSCWNYHQMPADFEIWIDQLEALSQELGLPVYNAPYLFRINMDKRYLLDLHAEGHGIVPTHITHAKILYDYTHAQACEALGLPLQTLVIKPVVSASGENTHLWKAEKPLPVPLFEKGSETERLWIIQPLVESITTHGECSLVFFKGRFSHGVCKRPVAHPFLVHEEHGGMTEAHVPASDLLAVAHRLMQAPMWKTTLAEQLYTRLDYIWYQKRWCLMEVELIEPALYLAYDALAPARWAQCLAFDIYG